MMLFLLLAGCTKDDILDVMKREIAYYDPQQDHSVYFKISDSGQDQSYTSTFGEDHDYTISSPSFTDNGNGSITDNITGLVWTKCSMGEDGVMDNSALCDGTHGEYKWQQSIDACENLVHGGRSNWRLPTFPELFTLVDFGNPGKGVVAIDDIFKGTGFTDCYNQSPGWSTIWTVLAQTELTNQESGKKYWTITQWTNRGFAHFISFDDGFSNINELTVSNYVRCVSNK